MKTFTELGLDTKIVQAIKKIGFYEPTPIQEASIPLILAGKDLIAGSQTGSGKTFAFGAGIIQRIHAGQGVQVLIQVPTRELAEQLLQTFKTFTKHTDLVIVAVYGGVSLSPQMKALHKADVVVGTPGRTLDLLDRHALKLKTVKHVVLDEADRMLDMGFLPDIKLILKQCPEQRQTLLFSATMPAEITKLAQQFMKNPEKINLAEHVDPQKLTQKTYLMPNGHKMPLLIHLLKKEEHKELVIIFTNTRRETDRVAKLLKKDGIKALPIHGGLTQNQRLQAIRQFNTRTNLNVLVCTDVAARGLDIPGVSHVYNYDIPNEAKQYIHRIGRTARAGADGIAVNFVTKRDQLNYKDVLKENKLRIPIVELPYLNVPKQTESDYDERPSRGRFPQRGEKRTPQRGSSRTPQRGAGRPQQSSYNRQERSEEEGTSRTRSHEGEGKSEKRNYDKKPNTFKKNFSGARPSGGAKKKTFRKQLFSRGPKKK